MKDKEQLEAEKEDKEGERENHHVDLVFSMYGSDWDLHEPKDNIKL